MIQMTGLQDLISKVERAKLVKQKKLTSAVQNLVRDVFTELVVHGPQSSGNLVLNYRIKFKGVSDSYDEIPTYSNRPGPYQRGDAPAVPQALNNELWKNQNIRYNTKVTISNEAPYAEEVEAGEGPGGLPIRDVNYVNGRIMMISAIRLKFERLSNLTHVNL